MRQVPPRFQLGPDAFAPPYSDHNYMDSYGNPAGFCASVTPRQQKPTKSPSLKSAASSTTPRGFKSQMTPKHHVLLCEKHVTCGSCPYEGKCKYIHDKEVASSCKFVNRPCKQDKDNGKFEARDSFFWPNSLSGGPNNEYLLSPSCEPKFYYRHRAVYSMWNHFKYFCSHTASQSGGDSVLDDPTNTINPFTATKRLDIFMTMSAGKSPLESVSPSPTLNPRSIPIHAPDSSMPVSSEEQDYLSSSPTSVSMLQSCDVVANQERCHGKIVHGRYGVGPVAAMKLLGNNDSYYGGIAIGAGAIDYQSPNFMTRKQFVL
jgi:hypothetical protein